jgi:hypothetical protein
MKRCRETSGVLNHEASKTHIVVSHCDGRDPAGEHCRDRLPALGRSIASDQHVPTFDPEFTSPDDAARMVRAQWRMPMGPVVNLTRWLEAAGCLVFEDDSAPNASTAYLNGSMIILLC